MRGLLWFCSFIPLLASVSYKSIIVIPDMHGDAEALLQSLYAGYRDVVNPPIRVSYDEFKFRFEDVIRSVRPPVMPLYDGKDVAIVQLGDLVDRGEHSLQCLLIMQAARMVTGFDVHQILGNHELALAAARPYFYARSVHANDDIDRRSQSDAMWNHVLGRKKFVPMIKLGDTLFVHAGVTLDQLAADRFIDALTMIDEHDDPVDVFNEMIWSDLLIEDERIVEKEYLSEGSFFTMRHYQDPDFDCEQVTNALDLFGASRVVVGHMSTRTNRVRQNCDGAIILADFMGSSYMNLENPVPHPGALMIEQLGVRTEPKLYALYYDNEAKTSYVDNYPFMQIAPLGVRLRQIIVSSISTGAVVPTGVHYHMTLLTTGDTPRKDGVIIRQVEISEETGLLIEFQSPSAFRPNLRPIEDKSQALVEAKQDSVIPRLFEVVSDRTLDVDVGAEDENVLSGPAIFVRTKATELLDRTMFYSDLVFHMTHVFDFLHEAKHCLGFIDGTKMSMEYLTDRLLEKFGIELNEMEIDLVDFSKIVPCTPAEIQFERNMFRDIVKHLGTANDHSSESEWDYGDHIEAA